MQELLERVQEYRDSETSPIVISRLNSVCVDILVMLEKEKEAMVDFAYKCRNLMAADENGNPICYDWESLYNYLEQLKNKKQKL